MYVAYRVHLRCIPHKLKVCATIHASVLRNRTRSTSEMINQVGVSVHEPVNPAKALLSDPRGELSG